MKTLTNLACLFAILLTTSIGLSAQVSDVLGNWITIDDDGVTKKSKLELFEKGGAVFGKVIELYNPSEKDPKCTNCGDDRKDQLIVGMEVIRGMEPKGDGKTLAKGTIVDPENGKVYKCTMWREGNELKVRGWIGFLYRTQTWKLAE